MIRNTLLKLAFLICLLPLAAKAQIYNPVKWTFEAEDKGNGDYELVFKANIEKGWHVYAAKLPANADPIPTSINFKKDKNYQLIGGLIEKGLKTVFDQMFQMDLSYYENQAIIRQKIKVSTKDAFSVKGELEFMVCNNERCLPADVLEFTIPIKSAGAETTSVAEPQAETVQNKVSSSNSSIAKPIVWSFSSVAKEKGIYEVQAKAIIAKGWHLYGQDLGNGDGPVPTKFTFPADANFEYQGKTTAPKPIVKYDPNFQLKLNFYENEVVFTQLVKPLSDIKIVKGDVEFMVCNDEKCLPPDVINFTVDLTSGKEIGIGETGSVLPNVGSAQLRNFKIPSIDLAAPASDCGKVSEAKIDKDSSLLSIFILGFFGGLIALLTPCVFPMIPLTVSFFTKGSGNKSRGIFNAVLYGFFIFLIYIILSLPFHFLDSLDPEILNTISTNVWLNLTFFVVFIVFAISFFGYFEITLPSGLANKTDSASEVGGIIGIFFMALTLALVSFSCTGPILGSLLAGSLTSDGGALQLTAGMGGFGFALALPFTVFALFPGMLKSLPKSGGWLNTVKVVLGFAEVALAVKFLSNADLVQHWGILPRELFFAIWILVGIGLALYLFGKIRFPHDSPIKKLSAGRIGFGIAVVAFVVYLIPGLSNSKYANLSLLSGFPPPLFYSYYEKASECPLNIACFKNYEEGMAYAKKVNKPVILDFTGWACVNCRKMEENVWVNPEIFERLNNDFVLISLYVDDRKPLPENEQFEYLTQDGRKKKIKTVGNKYSTLQAETFANNSQPYYALITPDEQLLNVPVGYTPNTADYKAFLDCGIKAFQSKQASANLK